MTSSKFQVRLGPSEKPISKFFTKKSTAHDQSGKPQKMADNITETNAPIEAKLECDESVEYQSEEIKQQQSGDKHTTWNTVKDEPSSLEPQVSEKPQSIKHTNLVSAKRKIEDTEVHLDTKMENSPSRAMKKEKGSKAASDGQASLLSYFAKK